MGVRITSSNAEWGGRPDEGDTVPLVPGRGIFSEELEAELAERGLGDVRATRHRAPAPGHDEAVEREQLSDLPGASAWRVTRGDSASRSARTCSSIRSPGGLDALDVCERTGFGVMQLPATWYPDDVAAGWLEQVAEQLDEYLRRGYAVVLLTIRRRCGGRAAARGARALRWPRSATRCRPSIESTGDADALEAFLRAQPVPGATA